MLCIAMFTPKVGSIGAVTHTMVKGLSRGKFAVVNFYSGKLHQDDFQLHLNLFTTVISGKHLKDL